MRFYLVLILSLVLFACKGSKSKFVSDNAGPDTIRYIYKTTDSLNCDSENCYYTSIKYPAIKNKPALNDTLNHLLFSYIDQAYKPNVDFIDFVKSYNKTTNAPVDTTRIDRSKLTGALVANHVIAFKLQIKDLAVLEISDELSGGAHPNFNVNFLNWDIKTDKAITADDIFIGNYKAPLTAIAEKIFREKRGVQKRAKLSGYNFENDIFALNNNFYITSKGITYLYNRYEITAYSEGEIELVIPYQLIKHLLRPNTVVSQFIK